MSHLKVTGYTVYPTGYDDTEVPSDKWHFTLKVEDRGKGWAVIEGPFVLTVDGDWEHEPIPSSRDEEFYRRCRFTEEDARRRALAAVDHITLNGRTFQQAVEWARGRS